MDERARLIEILKERSVRFGTFTLASGATSDFYVDARQTTLNAEGSWLVGRLVLARLAPEVEGVGGLTMGADPVVTATSVASWAAGRPVHAFLVRKQPKGHGTKRYVEGRSSLPDGARVCIVEDTTTTGGSLLQAVQRARDEGLTVVQTLTVVDRQEGAGERLAAEGLTLEALVTRADLVG
jgi:orotate phosphoribosyltransferase